MAAKWSGRARIAGMARSYNEWLQATGNWDMANKKPRLARFFIGRIRLIRMPDSR